MATISMDTDLDLLSKYNSLIQESLGGNSVYIRAKETIQDLAKNGDIKDADKATIISKVVSDLSTSLTNACLSTALQWASAEKELALKKLETEKQLDALSSDTDLKIAQTNKIKSEQIQIQANVIRQDGAYTTDADGNVINLADEGVQYEEMQLTKARASTESKNQTLLEARKDSEYASMNKIVADTYTNYGMFSGYTADANGITGITDYTPTSYKPLSYLQTKIAEEQAKGYTYNAWANVASGAGSTIGVALTSNVDIFTDNPTLLTDWSTAIGNLKNITIPTFN